MLEMICDASESLINTPTENVGQKLKRDNNDETREHAKLLKLEKERQRLRIYRAEKKVELQVLLIEDPAYKQPKRDLSSEESLEQYAAHRNEKKRNDRLIRKMAENEKELKELRLLKETFGNILPTGDLRQLDHEKALLLTWTSHSYNQQVEWLIISKHYSLEAIENMKTVGGLNYVTGIYIMIKV